MHSNFVVTKEYASNKTLLSLTTRNTKSINTNLIVLLQPRIIKFYRIKQNIAYRKNRE